MQNLGFVLIGARPYDAILLMYQLPGASTFKGVHMKSIILQAIFGIILMVAAVCLMLAYFDVLVP